MKLPDYFKRCTGDGRVDCRNEALPYTLHEVLTQYKNSPNLIGYIQTFIQASIDSIDDANDLTHVLDIDCLTGKNLDLIGEIIVQPRPYIGIDEPWFSLEDNNPTDPLSAGFNEGKWWDGLSPLLGKMLATDDVYRLFLKSKIVKNISKGTHNELSFVIQYLSCRSDIMIQGTNAMPEYPFGMLDDPETRGFGIGLFSEDDMRPGNPMTITLRGMEKPIDTFLFALFTQYDILPIPAGVKLIVDQS